MNRSKALLIAVLAGGLSVVAMAIFRPRAPEAPPPAPVAVAPSPGSALEPAATAPPFWTRRVGTEALVFAACGATVEFIDDTSKVLGTGRLDPAGAFRGTIPPGAGTLALKFAGGTAAVWRIPEGRGLLPSILSDRAVLHPGDRLRICVRAEAGSPPVLRLEPADPAVPAEEFGTGAESSILWTTYETSIPDDAGPGTAIVTAGKETLGIPIEGRFDAGDGVDSTPEAPPPSAPPLLLERRDGLWHAEGPADAEAILFFADAGGRLLSHQAVAAVDGRASTALPLGDLPPATFRATAVALTPRGFLEASVGRPGPPTLALDDDPVLSRFLAERPLPEPPAAGPAWIHEGDLYAGTGPVPPARQGYFARSGCAEILPGIEKAVDLPAGADVSWSVEPPEASGVLRIRGDGAILAETRIPRGGDRTFLRIADPAPRMLLAESDAPGLKAVLFGWLTSGKAEEAPAVPGSGVSLERTLPEQGAAGAIVEYRILIRWKGAPPMARIVCPIPRGAVLAEDGAAIRTRAPAGTRVEIEDGAVVFRLHSRSPGETALSFRIRLAWPGRYAAPAATVDVFATGLGPGNVDTARSASGFMTIL